MPNANNNYTSSPDVVYSKPYRHLVIFGLELLACYFKNHVHACQALLV